MSHMYVNLFGWELEEEKAIRSGVTLCVQEGAACTAITTISKFGKPATCVAIHTLLSKGVRFKPVFSNGKVMQIENDRTRLLVSYIHWSYEEKFWESLFQHSRISHRNLTYVSCVWGFIPDAQSYAQGKWYMVNHRSVDNKTCYHSWDWNITIDNTCMFFN